jgi:hypothetical protein
MTTMSAFAAAVRLSSPLTVEPSSAFISRAAASAFSLDRDPSTIG